MPELPDVERVRRHLTRWLRGATITSARSSDRRILRPTSPPAFSRALSGKAVRAVDRRGKWLRIVLDDDSRLFCHLGMTGDWTTCSLDEPAKRAERARLDVVKRSGEEASICYLDSRRFGRLLVAPDDIPDWRELGPDPLSDGLDGRKLAERLGSRRRAIKEALMDQTIVAGIGNIIATEALWRARIEPRSRTDALSPRDLGEIARALVKEIEREIAHGPAGGVEEFSVYGKAGKPCPRCGKTIARVTQGGRTTAYCGGCQRRR